MQLMHYLVVEKFIRKGEKVVWKDWKYVMLNKMKWFAVQDDDSSCGPYVCLMAKSVVLNGNFVFNKSFARNTIAHELS